VRGYRAGDLDQSFGRLRLEVDFVYAYGFMPAETRHLAGRCPDSASFRRTLDAELARLERFLVV
jgi:hypothetical protein